ncbi:MAG TPA: tetratricopeptide repeat protein [Pirellulales bacterium]|jgi:tetratricopeptide (TPR) repeat protein|nr:tetratricopeptide repeat protein [Pirellulales bacterium]
MATVVPDFSLAIRRFDEGRSDEATEICREIVAGQPHHAGALHMLGVAARQRGQLTESLELLDRALREAPERAVIWFDRGTTLYQDEQIEAALESYRRCAKLDPKLQEAALNLGAILEKKEQYEEALPWALRAIELRKDCNRAHYNLGNIYRATGQLRLAIAAYREAVRLQPDHAQAHWNLAHCYLLLGDFANGWPAYEWRERANEVFFDRHTGPRWDGTSLTGKTLLVHAEQGIGDEIMFAGCYDEVVAQAKQCIFVCEPRLEKLFKRSFSKATVHAYGRRSDWAPASVRESYDWQIPAGSLALHLRRSVADFPIRRRFLVADATAVDRWRDRMATLGSGLKIGISWRAGGKPSERRRRSTTLTDWQPLLALPGTHWINLQYGETSDELSVARDHLGVEIHDFAEGDPLIDMDDFAAKVSALDLVLSVGNATVHLAGALGVNTWALLPPIPGWRWQIDGSTTPWYPSVRLYRQPVNGSVPETLSRIKTDLTAALRSGNLQLPLAASSNNGSSLSSWPQSQPAPESAGTTAADVLLPISHDSQQFTDRALPAALAKATEHHRAGQLVQAEQIYREVLYHLPRNIDAQRQLGILARQTGRVELAISSLRRALAAGDSTVDTRICLAASLRDADKLDEALSAYQESVRLAPESADARLGLAKTLIRQYRPDDARSHLEEALSLMPDFAEAHLALAGLLADDGQHVEALAACDRALAANPNYALAHARRGEWLHLLGQTQAATAALDVALSIQPDRVDWLRFLAELLKDQGRFHEAEQIYRKAQRIEPANAMLLNDLGLVLTDQGCLAEGLVAYEAALNADPGFPLAHFNRSLVWLQQGRLAEGWHEFRWRWKCPDFPARDFFRQPSWDGSSLAGKTILVHGEQGIGDEIMFASCLPDIVERARQVVVVCEPRLAPLLARSFPTVIVHGVGRGREHLWTVPASPAVDVQTPIGDLPRHVRPSLASFPKRKSFLRANPARIEYWRDRLAKMGPGPKIGISWRAGARPQDRRQRSAPLPHWQSLLNGARAQFISLEYGDCQAEIETCRRAGAALHVLPGIDAQNNLDELAATISALDLVISVGNGSVHLAGALGVPTWALLPRYQGWCWPLDREAMPWYASVRVLRHADDGDWSGLLARVETEFLNWLSANSDKQR